MKRIGIITHYYNSTNFGGNLQAYALCSCLKKLSYDAEQISFDYMGVNEVRVKASFMQRLKRITPAKIVLKFKAKYKTLKCNDEKKYNVSLRRRKAFENFNKFIIPHSEAIYEKNNISEAVSRYDVFITGSDQVWNMEWYYPEFFLDFVPSDKIKMSYAASIAKTSLTDEQKEIFKHSLMDYNAVSVREKSAEKLISELSPVSVKTVIDPTMLLDSEDWDKVCSERVTEEKYIFCYFLGENKRSRKLAEKFAKKNGFTVVTVPHAGGWIKTVDKKFGDLRLFDASPEDFISLIKHAEYVFTDSFHAVVFSNIYQKQYFIFKRDEADSMSSRITDITELYNTQDRFCYDEMRENLKYVSQIKDINYAEENQKLLDLKRISIEFLKDNLGGQE